MKRTIPLTESRIRKIIREVVDSVANEDQEPEHEYIEMTGERFDEILRQNGITVEDLLFALPGIDIDEMIDYFRDDDYPREEDIFESWEQTVYSDERFENFVRSLGGLTQQDMDAVNGYVEAWYCDSELVKRAFNIMYEEAYEKAREEWHDALSYKYDPLSYYGVKPSDFY